MLCCWGLLFKLLREYTQKIESKTAVYTWSTWKFNLIFMRKSTLVTCNSLINVAFNNTLANNSNKECLMKVCLEHDPRGCLFICLCTAALMIFLFLLLTASNKKPVFRTFHKICLFQWCNIGRFHTVEKLQKGELSKKLYEK